MLSLICCFFFSFFPFSFLFSKDRTPSYPFISGDGFRALTSHILDEDLDSIVPEKIGEKEIVFVKTEFLDKFFLKYHPKIEFPYILITHNSDLPIPSKWRLFLEDPKIIAWFGQNVEEFSHRKLIPIPIGLPNQYNLNASKENYIRAMKKCSKLKKKYLLYFNMNLETCLEERKKAYDYFSSFSPCFCVFHLLPFRAFIHNLIKSKFVVSPRGNGLDCHRTWEALYLGAIPIVKSTASDSLYEDLPALVVNDWKEVSVDLLEKKLQEYKTTSFNKEKLFFPYWKKKIFSYTLNNDPAFSIDQD